MMKKIAHPQCPIAQVAILLSDKWTMMVLHDLIKEPMRFCKLHKSLKTISTRTLALKLKRLEALGMIEKNEICYAVTATGKKIKPIMDEMAIYGEKYL